MIITLTKSLKVLETKIKTLTIYTIREKKNHLNGRLKWAQLVEHWVSPTADQ